MSAELKRVNFNITQEQDAELNWLHDSIGTPSVKDAILRSVRIVATLVREQRKGNDVYLGSNEGRLSRLIIPELEHGTKESWNYLVARPHAWRRQLYVKGRRLLASSVWRDMIANDMSVKQAASNWDLPIEAIEEILRYCEQQRDLVRMEAEEERCRLEEAGISVARDSER